MFLTLKLYHCISTLFLARLYLLASLPLLLSGVIAGTLSFVGEIDGKVAIVCRGLAFVFVILGTFISIWGEFRKSRRMSSGHCLETQQADHDQDIVELNLELNKLQVPGEPGGIEVAAHLPCDEAHVDTPSPSIPVDVCLPSPRNEISQPLVDPPVFQVFNCLDTLQQPERRSGYLPPQEPDITDKGPMIEEVPRAGCHSSVNSPRPRESPSKFDPVNCEPGVSNNPIGKEASGSLEVSSHAYSGSTVHPVRSGPPPFVFHNYGSGTVRIQFQPMSTMSQRASRRQSDVIEG
ncbi:hypothetical protein V5O48_006368 [Marasmius crinis-equi]|uniref:Uncharacterized protein n=1 Tax=Marasmius crinis-equi TaxID=585013 RepID=A0ABR3FJQ4_9AGAR